MELRDLLIKEGIIGVIGNYKTSLDNSILVSDILVKDLSKALKIVGLNDELKNKRIKDLTISELWKVDLISKLNKEIIIIGNMFNSLIYKDREYYKKLFIKLNKTYNKKIIIIDNNLNTFFNLTKNIYVIKNKKIIYKTKDYYDKELLKYINKPKIIEFIEYVNKDSNRLNKNIDIYELIKDIYRGVS